MYSYGLEKTIGECAFGNEGFKMGFRAKFPVSCMKFFTDVFWWLILMILFNLFEDSGTTHQVSSPWFEITNKCSTCFCS